MKHDGVAVVEFYAPWCGHCKTLAPEYENAASVLKGVVKVVALDATANEKTAQTYGIKGFPTLKVFGADKKNPVDYQGQRTSDAIISEAMKAANQMVKDRKKGKGGKSSGADKKEEKPKTKKSKGGSKVVTLTESNFESTVLDSNDHWFVEFYAPWCGHCKNLAPEWEEAAKKLDAVAPNIHLGAVDATEAAGLASKYGVKGYPTIKQFNAGKTGKDKKGKEYRGPREAAGIVDFALQSLEAVGAALPVEVDQLTSPAQFEEKCGADANKICVVLFLPHILDSMAKGRDDYISLVKGIAKDFRGKPMQFLWTEAGAQPALESALDLNNYPSMGVVQVNKQASSALRLSWSKKNIKGYLDGLISGSERLSKLSTVPAVVKVDAWDGKDGEAPAEEINLADLMKD